MPRHAVSSPTPPRPPRFTVGVLALAGALGGLAGPAEATTVGPLLELNTPPAGQRAPAVSWDEQEQVYVIVWEDRRNAGSTGVDLYVARIDSAGMLLDASGHPLLDPSAAADDETQPTIVYNPNTFAHLIAWTEARQGLSDIFFTRLFAARQQMVPTIVPTAGVQVTSTDDSEIEPDVAVAFQTFLVAFQSNVVGGGRLIRGRRVYPDGSFLDETVLDLSPVGGGSPATLGNGSTFYVGYNNDGDIFARSLPDFGAVATASIAEVAVTTATLGQSRTDLAWLSSRLTAVWQDNRAFGTLEADVFGRSFDANLMPLSADGPILTATAAQQFPAIAGNATGGLVVWQDRRFSTSNAIIYGARVDPTTGQSRDPEGFPILALPANAFEPTVAKGPGNDFIVAGVKFDAAAPRIYYRIVRDELPDGTMTPVGNLMVPADGVTTADVRFGPAVGPGPDFLNVVDGTLYTVTLSNNAVEIAQPDKDPNMSGHQVEAVAGEVLVRLRSTEHVMVDVTVDSVEGFSSGTAQVTFLNVPPVATNVVVGPPSPRSVEPLDLTYDYFDVNADPEDTTRRYIQWTANSQVKAAFNNMTTVPGSATVKGEQWRAELRPHDGIEFGERVFSNTVIIRNTPPEALDVRIVLDNAVTEARTGTGMRGSYVFDDADGDAELGTEIRWYESGVEQTDLRDLRRVPGSRVIKAQRWHFTVRPSDGDPDEGFGQLVTSDTVTVVNTPPVAAEQSGPGEVLERRRYTLDGSGSSDVDPQDVLQYRWRQVIQGSEPEIELSSTSSPTPSFLAPPVEGRTVLFFELVVRDDEVDSQPETFVVNITAVPDQDGDRLDDEEEVEAGTSPTIADTDRDGLRDGEEVKGFYSLGEFTFIGTDPLDADSDDDGVRDGAEGRSTKDGEDFDILGDPDEDGIINALDPDSDNDGIYDGTELAVRNAVRSGMNGDFAFGGTDESAGFFVADADPNTFTNPNDKDTDDDTFEDGVEDANHNGAIDDGESDPNDPEDPGIDCSGGAACPDGFSCVEGICRLGSTDGGLMCTPLPETLECCTGGCSGGTFVEPICTRQGARESCPVGATQCVAGACSAPTGPGPDSGGCVTATRGDQTSTLWLMALGLLAFLRRRRG